MKTKKKDSTLLDKGVLKRLMAELSHVEMKVLMGLICRADEHNHIKFYTKEPTVRDLSDMFDVSTGVVAPVFKKMFDLNVFAKFDVNTDDGTMYTWLLNPYLSFSGVKENNRWIFAMFEQAEAHKRYYESKK